MADDVTILHAKVFDFLTGFIVDDFAVAEHAVDIKKDCPDVASFLDLCFRILRKNDLQENVFIGFRLSGPKNRKTF